LKAIQKISIIIILLLISIEQNIVAQDTIPVSKPVTHKFLPDPLKATMMAVAFPGLGQIYNRKYWKIPLVYAGFGGLIYAVGFNSKNYNLFMKAYQDFTDTNPLTKSYESLINANPSTYDPVLFPKTYVPANAAYFQGEMLQMIDYYKRYRDLSYIGIAGWYLLSILDANVDASLFNYDISNNLDITLVPVNLTLPGGFTGAGLNVSFKLTF
jgi:Family of unknown function (DUF5683)